MTIIERYKDHWKHSSLLLLPVYTYTSSLMVSTCKILITILILYHVAGGIALMSIIDKEDIKMGIKYVMDRFRDRDESGTGNEKKLLTAMLKRDLNNLHSRACHREGQIFFFMKKIRSIKKS